MGALARRDVFDAAIGSSVVLYDPATAQAHLLNDTAALVWQCSRELPSVDAVVADVAARFPDRSDAVEGDVRVALSAFDARGLLGDPKPAAPQPEPQVASPPLWRGGGVAESWPTTRTFAVIGERLGFRGVDPALVAAIDGVLAPLAVDGAPAAWFDVGPGVDGTTEVWRGDHHIQTHQRGDDVVESLPYLLNRMAFDRSDVVVLHAAGIVHGGGAVVLPAEPDAGKSTLVAALVQAGSGYLSDEAVGIPLGGRSVLSYPKRIALDARSLEALPGFEPTDGPTSDGRWHIDPRILHADALSATHTPTALSHCILPTYRPGAEVQVERLPPEQALLALLANAFNLRATGAAGLDTLADIAREIPCYRFEHGGASDGARALLDALGDSSA